MGVEYLPTLFVNFYYHVSIVTKKIKDQIYNTKNRSSIEMSNSIFDHYKNSAMPHGRHSYKTEYGMSVATTCAYPTSQYTWTHWNCLFSCYENCPYIDIPSK